MTAAIGHGTYKQAAERLNCFILGLAEALTAYLGKDLSPPPLDPNMWRR
jgi:hypothetical protein